MLETGAHGTAKSYGLIYERYTQRILSKDRVPRRVHVQRAFACLLHFPYAKTTVPCQEAQLAGSHDLGVVDFSSPPFP